MKLLHGGLIILLFYDYIFRDHCIWFLKFLLLIEIKYTVVRVKDVQVICSHRILPCWYLFALLFQHL